MPWTKIERCHHPIPIGEKQGIAILCLGLCNMQPPVGLTKQFSRVLKSVTVLITEFVKTNIVHNQEKVYNI